MFAMVLGLATSLPYILYKLRNWHGIVFALVGLGLYFLVVLGKEKWEVYRTQRWPVTEAPVEAVRVERVDAGPNGVDYWKLHFNYTYEVTARHSGSYTFNLVTDKLKDEAEAGMAGKTVRVHYNPKDESKSVLWEDEVWALW
jgi:hypothetical protein